MNRSEWICLVKASPKFAMWKISSNKCIKSAIKFKNRKKNNKTLLILPLHGYSKLALQYYLPMLSLVISVFYTSTSKYIHKSILLIINYIPSETHTGFDPAENNLITTFESKVYMDGSSNFIFHSYSLSIFSSTIQNLFLPRKVLSLNENSNYICTSYIISTWKRKKRKHKWAFFPP